MVAIIGIGVTTYTEICGLGPSEVNGGAIGLQGWRVGKCDHPYFANRQSTGTFIGTSPHGQGFTHDTLHRWLQRRTWSTTVEDIEVVVHSDTDMKPRWVGGLMVVGQQQLVVRRLAGASSKTQRKSQSTLAAHLARSGSLKTSNMLMESLLLKAHRTNSRRFKTWR